MSDQQNLQDIPSAIFSPGSADGHLPWTSPDGREISPSGLVAALANLSHRQVKALGLTTSGISGPLGNTSSRSVRLQSSLESRLQVQLTTAGSILFQQTWKVKATLSGRRYLAHTASARPISDSGCGSWVTASSRDWKDTPGMVAQRVDGRSRVDQLPRQAYLARWVIPTAQDGSRGSLPPRPHDTGVPLSRQVAECGPARYTADGTLLTGYDAGMTSGVQLSPEHSRWLMGYPVAWGFCADTATQSSRKWPPSSFGRTQTEAS